MTTHVFPSRRPDGSAEVAAVFRAPLEASRHDIQQAIGEWSATLEGIDTTADLADEPGIASSTEGFRVIFEIKPGSRLWKDWTVTLVSAISDRLGADSFVGFFDEVAGRMHPATRQDLIDNGGPSSE